jgi:hypothetical protein
MNKKTEAAPWVIKKMNQIKNITGRWPLFLFADQGTELLNKQIGDFCSKNGIEFELAPVDTPQHNGRVERLNRTIKEKATAMLVEAQAPKLLWGEASTYAVAIRNQTRIVPKKFKTAHELLFDKKPSITLFHVFGCDAWVLEKDTPKFDPPGDPVVFVGLSIDATRGFRFMSMDGSYAITESRHAKFDDNSFKHMNQMMEAAKENGDEEESDEEYFASVANRGEIRLAKLISLESQQPSSESSKSTLTPPPARSASQLNQLTKSPVQLERSSRIRKPPLRLGMIDPNDMAQGLASGVYFALTEACNALAEPPAIPKQFAKKTGEAQRKAAQEALRLQHVHEASGLTPIPADRKHCNKKGEIITPSQQCTVIKADGTQCNSKTRNNDMCWIHLSQTKGLRIKSSLIPLAGKGLFAARDFQKNEKVSPYSGDLLVTRAADPDHGGSSYVLQTSNDKFVDAARKNTAPGRLVNDPRGSAFQSNTKFVINRQAGTASIQTTKAVKKGSEFFIPYGPGYWRAINKAEAEKQAKKKAKEVRRKAKKMKEVQLKKIALANSALTSLPAPSYEENEPDPLTFTEAMNSRSKDYWVEAMENELNSLRKNEVYEVLDSTPPNINIVTCKWVFRIKRNQINKTKKYKARLVARGFTQVEGVDYFETFAPVLSYRSFRVMIALSVHFGYKISCMDVETAFLQADVQEDIYIRLPTSASHNQPESGKVLKLKKALYGIKQAPHCFNEIVVEIANSLDYFSNSDIDACFFVKLSRTKHHIFLCVFVDDFWISNHPSDDKEILEDKEKLKKLLTIVDSGAPSLFLGMNIIHNHHDGSITVTHEQYLTKVLALYGYRPSQVRIEATPEAVVKKLIDSSPDSSESTAIAEYDNNSEKTGLVSKETFRSVIGILHYIAGSTRPDITHIVHLLCRCVANPTDNDVIRARRVMRYLCGTINIGIKFTKHSSLNLACFSDADWITGPTKNEVASTTGVVVKLSGGPVLWTSKKQSCIALSTTESEYIAATEGAKDLIWITALLNFLQINLTKPPILFVDNRAAITLASSEGNTIKNRHINCRFGFLRQQVQSKAFTISWVPTNLQQADLFTKAFSKQSFVKLRNVVLGYAPDSTLAVDSKSTESQETESKSNN